MGMAVTEGIEMQQVGQDMMCNSDDKIVNAKVNNMNHYPIINYIMNTSE